METEADIRAILREELERRDWIEEGRRFKRNMKLMAAVIVLEVLAVYALIIWRGL